jgi:hypothetical protein
MAAKEDIAWFADIGLRLAARAAVSVNCSAPVLLYRPGL